jgi:hypothetical protein
MSQEITNKEPKMDFSYALALVEAMKTPEGRNSLTYENLMDLGQAQSVVADAYIDMLPDSAVIADMASQLTLLVEMHKALQAPTDVLTQAITEILHAYAPEPEKGLMEAVEEVVSMYDACELNTIAPILFGNRINCLRIAADALRREALETISMFDKITANKSSSPLCATILYDQSIPNLRSALEIQ